MIRIGLIDNYDSFTYNLVQLLGAMVGGDAVRVWRNDAINLAGLEAATLSHLIISPGPGTPGQTGISIPAIRHFAGRIPLLGVCMGQQCLAAAWGGRVVRAARPMHGKTSDIYHDGRGLFFGLPNPFVGARYHSLIVEPSTLPSEFEISAWTRTGEIMGLRHRTLILESVQFHPESFLTPDGPQIISNFIHRACQPQGRRNSAALHHQ